VWRNLGDKERTGAHGKRVPLLHDEDTDQGDEVRSLHVGDRGEGGGITDISSWFRFGGISMTKVGEVYKCELCGNVVKVIEEGAGELVCCGEPMVLQK
jgi:desulfoferrodoxin-like iron-binding protein